MLSSAELFQYIQEQKSSNFWILAQFWTGCRTSLPSFVPDRNDGAFNILELLFWPLAEIFSIITADEFSLTYQANGNKLNHL